MARTTGIYRVSTAGGETVRAFVPFNLPPGEPELSLDPAALKLLASAEAAIGRLTLAAALVPSVDWFLYGFVRQEALISSQIEGTQATLRDVLHFEATGESARPDDVEDVCNYVDALIYARREIARPRGLPLSTRLLCGAHARLMRGVRGAEKHPGHFRRSQNWIGGSRPGNARYVPSPPESVAELMGALEGWMHAPSLLHPVVRAGLAHVQFETIHPFLDGNGRIGRLLITLLLEHWKVLSAPVLYLSLALKQRQAEYYQRLSAVRTAGDWEGWTTFFLECVAAAADHGATVAARISACLSADRQAVLARPKATVTAMRALDLLPRHPVITLPRLRTLLETTTPTASAALAVLVNAKVLKETSGKRRDRVYAYQRYLAILEGVE